MTRMQLVDYEGVSISADEPGPILGPYLVLGEQFFEKLPIRSDV